MPGSPFDIPFERLPPVVPIFPLSGVLLLPGGRLPLNIFEPRYQAMVSDALAYPRLIGMVQPQDSTGASGNPPVYRVGCAGRILSFSETDDGRYLITLAGLARFDITAELPLIKGYRPVRVEWSRFRGDFATAPADGVDRTRLLTVLKPYFDRHEISCDWDAVTKTEDQHLITTLAMVCPFAPNEKQALLESATLAERATLLTALIEMASGSATPERGLRH